MFTASSFKKIAVVCIDCARGVVTIGGALELGYKVTHGGVNAMSPLRQEWLNKTFPDDKTKIWTESKASMALHNRAMGNPHDSIGDNIIKTLPKEK